jgi:hypothetical protein
MREISGLGLIEDREGRIIMLIESTAHELESLLTSLTANNLGMVRTMASSNAESLRSLLSELHDLNGRILGYSGRMGLLELTRDRHQLEREIQIMIDKRDQSITHGDRVSMGDNNSVGQLIVSNSIQGSFNTIERSAQSDDLKESLKLLCAQVQDLLSSMPAERQREVKQDLDNLVTEATKEAPRRKWYELSDSGLVDAAKACAGAASPVIATVSAVVRLLARN